MGNRRKYNEKNMSIQNKCEGIQTGNLILHTNSLFPEEGQIDHNGIKGSNNGKELKAHGKQQNASVDFYSILSMSAAEYHALLPWKHDFAHPSLSQHLQSNHSLFFLLHMQIV